MDAADLGVVHLHFKDGEAWPEIPHKGRAFTLELRSKLLRFSPCYTSVSLFSSPFFCLQEGVGSLDEKYCINSNIIIDCTFFH